MRTLIAVIGFMAVVNARAADDPALFEALRLADAQVFTEGFNKCNLRALEEAIHPELEFMHDVSGMQRRDMFLKTFRENICGNPDRKPIRRLVEGSVEVHALKNGGTLYGAVQMGRHEFLITEPGKEPRLTGKARFVHTWLRDGERWRLYRVISYDHGPAGS